MSTKDERNIVESEEDERLLLPRSGEEEEEKLIKPYTVQARGSYTGHSAVSWASQ